MHLSRPLIPLLLCLWPLAVAAEPFAGSLIAERDCPAGISTRHQKNPGQIRLVPGQIYLIVARNKPEPTYYQLRIESADPQDRWVKVSCGRFVAPLSAAPRTSGEPQPSVTAPALAALPTASPTPVPAAPAANRADGMDAQYVLCAIWQPAFCEPRPNRPECVSLTPERVDARQFSLHGLWPQPIGRAYCGIAAPDRQTAESGDWGHLPRPDLSTATRTQLERRMPGTAGGLERHEWAKHGSCYGTDAETYFRQALALLAQLNDSQVQRLFESNIGNRLRAEQVQVAFDRAFGPGSGERVRLECDQEGRITELRIRLKGPIRDRSALAELIRAAPTHALGCRGGWVDRAGPGR